MTTERILTTQSRFGTVGLDLGIAGRILRFLIGAAMVSRITYGLARSDLMVVFVAEAALYFLASLAIYAAAFYFLRERILARMNAWIGTAIILMPVLIVLIFDIGPPAFQVGLRLYVGVSLIIAAFMRYGGCEVVSIPSLVFGGRYVVYCPYNVIDVAEKAVVDRRKEP